MVGAHAARLTVAVDHAYRRAVAQDVCTLINHYLSKVAGGLPEAFTTLREAWQDLNFSFVYTGHSARVAFPDHLQLLFSAALQFLDQPFPPMSTQEEDQLSTELDDAVPGLDTLHPASNPPPDQLSPGFTDSELRELLGLDELPSTGATAPPAAAPAESERALPAAQGAAIYTVYALFKAQPTTSKAAAHAEQVAGVGGGASTSAGSSAASVPIYLPLGLLQELMKLLQSKPGTDLWPIVMGLWRSNAFVLGAARQPPLWRHAQPARPRMASAKHRPSPACLKAAAHLANNLMRNSNPAAKLELLAASCQRAQDHVAALAPKQLGSPQWTASLTSSGLDRAAAALHSSVREALAKPPSRPSTAGSQASAPSQPRRTRGRSALANATASRSAIPQAARLAEQRAQERRAARAQTTAAWLAWQAELLRTRGQAEGHAAAAAAGGASEDEAELVRQTVNLPGIRELLSAEDGLELDASSPSDDEDSGLDSDAVGDP